MANLMNDSDDSTLFSRSLLSRRHRPSQANVRSTVQRIGSFTQPSASLGPADDAPGPTPHSSRPTRRGRSCDTCCPRYIRLTLLIGWPSSRANNSAAACGVIDVGGRDQHGQQQPHAVHDDMALPAVDVLGVVPAPLLAAGGGVDRLAVDAGGGAGVVGLLRGADLAAKPVVDRVEGAVAPPLVEVPPDGTLGREVAGQVTPLAAGAEDVEDGVDDVPHVGLSGSPAGRSGRDVGLDQGPLLRRSGRWGSGGFSYHFYAARLPDVHLMGQTLRGGGDEVTPISAGLAIAAREDGLTNSRCDGRHRRSADRRGDRLTARPDTTNRAEYADRALIGVGDHHRASRAGPEIAGTRIHMNHLFVMVAGQSFDHVDTRRRALPRSKVNVAIPDMDGCAAGSASVLLRKGGRSRVVEEFGPMAAKLGNVALREIGTLFAVGTIGGMSDGQLIERFLSGSRAEAEAAFAALVGRHGAMVMGSAVVCCPTRTMLTTPSRPRSWSWSGRAHSIARRDLLANWLYGVAYRTARVARTRAAQRRAKERQVMGVLGTRSTQDEAACGDLLVLLDEELSRLPEKFRIPVVLCELEGRSRKEAALRLGIAEGTLSSRLARARGLLRDRLEKRGLALGAGALAAGLPREVSAATVRPALANATVQAALRYATGGVVPGSVTTLAEGVLKAMFLTKLKAGAVALLALCTMASLAALATARAQADRDHRRSGRGGGRRCECKHPAPSRPGRGGRGKAREAAGRLE